MTEEDTVLVSTEDQPVEQRPRRRNRGALLFVRDLLIIFLAAILISFLVKTFLIRSFFIPSGSMRETLQVAPFLKSLHADPRWKELLASVDS